MKRRVIYKEIIESWGLVETQYGIIDEEHLRASNPNLVYY